jgi:hypothetical protein
VDETAANALRNGKIADFPTPVPKSSERRDLGVAR